MTVAEQVSASKKYGADEASELLSQVDTVFVTKGRAIVELAADDDQLPDALLGRTGNLRAPALRQGKRLFVGFPKEGFPALRG